MRNMAIAFLLLIAADSLIGQIDSVGELVYIIQQALIAWFIYYLVSYNPLTLKTIAFIFAITEVSDIACYLNDEISYIMFWIDLTIIVPWLLYAAWRTHDKSDIPKDDGYIYLVSHKPNNFLDFLVSIWSNTSGYSVLAHSYIYGYKKGVFTKREFINLPSMTIKRTHIKASGKVMYYLESMIGKTWHAWQNCVTMQIKLRTISHV